MTFLEAYYKGRLLLSRQLNRLAASICPTDEILNPEKAAEKAQREKEERHKEAYENLVGRWMEKLPEPKQNKRSPDEMLNTPKMQLRGRYR